jgi:hypothetical protein
VSQTVLDFIIGKSPHCLPPLCPHRDLDAGGLFPPPTT